MGAGPGRIARELGVTPEEIEARGDFHAEIKTAFDLYGRLAERVHARGGIPVVLAGNCGACVGTAAGIGMDDLAVIWFDAHGDFMTPDTTTSGFLDGMGLSILTGRCFHKLAQAIPRYKPLPTGRALHVGGRDWSEGELEDCHSLGVGVADGVASAGPAIEKLASRAKRILIHVDLDVIDPKYGKANQFAAPGGLSPDEVIAVIEASSRRFTIAGVELASYDPSFDPRGTIAAAGARIAKTALGYSNARRSGSQ